MTLVSTIIQDAFEEGNLVAAGVSPSAARITSALRRYNALVRFMLGGEAGENLTDWPLGNYGRQADDYLCLTTEQIANPPINARLIHAASTATTIYFPENPSDGSRMAIVDPFSRLGTYNVTLNGNGRTIETTATVTLSTNGLSREWFYRADTGNWVRVSDLTTSDQSPFPSDFDDLQVIMLFLRLAPRHGRKLSETSAAILKQQRQQFAARYAQSQNLAINTDLANSPEQAYGGFFDESDASLYGY